MTEVTCDGCGKKQSQAAENFFKIRLLDGEHPHNGSRMYQTVDACVACLRGLDLVANVEVETFKKRR